MSTGPPCQKTPPLTPLLLVTTKLKVLASLQGELVLGLARGALESEDDFLGLHVEREGAAREGRVKLGARE